MQSYHSYSCMALLLADSSTNEDASILLRCICAEYLLSTPPTPQKKEHHSPAKTGSFSLYAEEFSFFKSQAIIHESHMSCMNFSIFVHVHSHRVHEFLMEIIGVHSYLDSQSWKSWPLEIHSHGIHGLIKFIFMAFMGVSESQSWFFGKFHMSCMNSMNP